MDQQNNYPPETPNDIASRLVFFVVVIVVMLFAKYVLGI